MTTETIFRKVSVEERLPSTSAHYFTDRGYIIFGKNTNKFQESKNFYPKYWLEELPLSTLAEQLEGEARSLTANRNILETIKQQNEKLLAEIAKESNEKDKQIQELKDDVIWFKVWCETKESDQYEGLTTEQLFSKYKDSKKQR